MRDWARAFFPASFRGVPFRVDTEEPEFGRRVAVHEISGGGNLTEDMGSLIGVQRVRGYVLSDLADLAGRALEAACRLPGPGFLMLPMAPGLLANCTRCGRLRSKDRNGHIAYDLEFLVADAGAAASPGAIAALSGVLASGGAGAAAAMARVFR